MGNSIKDTRRNVVFLSIAFSLYSKQNKSQGLFLEHLMLILNKLTKASQSVHLETYFIILPCKGQPHAFWSLRPCDSPSSQTCCTLSYAPQHIRLPLHVSHVTYSAAHAVGEGNSYAFVTLFFPYTPEEFSQRVESLYIKDRRNGNELK